MVDYISRDEAIERIQPHVKPQTVYGEGYLQAIEHATAILGLMPATDVQPVKRGRWIISNLYAQCSECSVAYDLDTFQRLIPMNENVPRHCSYCGADMRGGAENDT